RWEYEHHVHISRWLLIGFCLLGAPLFSWRAPLLPSRSPDLFRKIRTRLPQHVEVLCFCLFQTAQALHPALLRAIEPVRTPPRAMVPVFFFWLRTTSGWAPHMVILTCSGPQAPEHRCLVLLASLRPALQAIIYSRQLAHAGIPIIPEERAVPVVTYSLVPPSVLPVRCSYSSSSDSYRRRNLYWYWYFSRSRLEAGSWLRMLRTCSSVTCCYSSLCSSCGRLPEVA